jgi:flagellar motor switch protein FliM
VTDREIMQQALEALTRIWEDGLENYPEASHERVMDALRERLAQPEHIIQTNDGRARINSLTGDFGIGTPSQPEQEPVDESLADRLRGER